MVATPGFRAPLFFEWLAECAATWYTAVPTMHQAVLARAVAAGNGTATRSPLRFVRSSSASLPPPVSAALEQVFGIPSATSSGQDNQPKVMFSTG